MGRKYAKSLLFHYFELALTRQLADIPPDRGDIRGEIEEIVDEIVDAAVEEAVAAMKAEVSS